jgi:predicted DNA-binding protein
MATTTIIRMQDALKARVASAAKRAGKTTHGFILEAIAAKTELEDLRANFDAEADARFAEVLRTGKTIPWSDMRDYLVQRSAGSRTRLPRAKTSRRAVADVLANMPDVGEEGDFEVRKS